MREVAKQEFDEIIAKQDDLFSTVSGISEPPTLLYSKSVNGITEPFAAVVLNESYARIEDGGVYPYFWSPNIYKIMDGDK
jgi:hypothetical protein